LSYCPLREIRRFVWGMIPFLGRFGEFERGEEKKNDRMGE